VLVERVMRSPHADGAPRIASSVNGHWLGALSNSEQPPSLWNCADQLTIKARPGGGASGVFLGRSDLPWRARAALTADCGDVRVSSRETGRFAVAKIRSIAKLSVLSCCWCMYVGIRVLSEMGIQENSASASDIWVRLAESEGITVANDDHERAEAGTDSGFSARRRGHGFAGGADRNPDDPHQQSD